LDAKEIHSYAELVMLVRERIAELNVSHETVDLVSGLQGGYTSKIIVGQKRLGPVSWDLLFGALALKIIVVEDAGALALVRSRLVPRIFARREHHWRDRLKCEPVAETVLPLV
jgi:hypothetical protein